MRVPFARVLARARACVRVPACVRAWLCARAEAERLGYIPLVRALERATRIEPTRISRLGSADSDQEPVFRVVHEPMNRISRLALDNRLEKMTRIDDSDR